MRKTYTIKINTDGGAIQAFDHTAGQAQATVVQVGGQTEVELVEVLTGRAPQKLAVRRVANDLQVVFEGGSPDEPDLILQDFYGGPGTHLTGIAENGESFEYVPTSGDGADYPPVLPDGGSSVQVLGVTVATNDAVPTGLSPWWLGAVGFGVVVAAYWPKDKCGTDPVAPLAPVIVSSVDNIGIYQGNVASGAVTNDATPAISGTAEAGRKITVLDDGQPIGTTMTDTAGRWSFTPTVPLTDGSHVITTKATDTAGLESPGSSPWTVLVDTIPPDRPVIAASNDNVGIYTGDVPGGKPTNDVTPLMSGTAEANSLVSIFEAGVLVGTVNASALGTWSFVPTFVAEGVHAMTATATDAAGNTSLLSEPWNVLIDTIAPLPPVIVASSDNVGIYTGDIPSGNPTNDTTPLMSGTAEADSLVSLFDAGVLKGTTLATAAGTWSLVPELDGQGMHAMTATATDAAGNTSLLSDPWNVNIDTIAPLPPVVVSSNDNFGIYTGDVPSGNATNDTTPLMSGTAEANSLVSLFDAGVLVGTVDASALGAWSFTHMFSGEGIHVITAKATDAAGNTSPPSEIWNLNLDTIAPRPPVIVSSNDNVGIYTGDIPSGTATNDTTPLMSGTAEANSLVSVFEAGVLVGTTGASALGAWSFTPTLTGEGPHAITATATDAAGNTSLPSEPWTVFVDTIPPRPPVIVASNDNFGIYTGDIPSGTPTNDTTPRMSGTAEANSLVSLFDAGVAAGTVYASALGAWSFTPTLSGEGPHAMTAKATDSAGNASLPSEPWSVLIDTIPPRPPVIVTSNDNVGIYTGNVPSGTATNDTTPLMSGTAEANSLVSVFEAGVLVGTTGASALGAWSFTPTLTGEGPHAMTATATDAAGNASLPSEPWSVLIDTIAPRPPVIVTSNDNFGIYTGDIPSGIATNDTTPLMSGTAEANSLVSVFEAGVLVGTASASALGAWSFTPTLTGEGPHAITARATDAAGNTSLPSEPWTVFVDTIPPRPPVIVTSNDNVGIYTGNVPSGTATNDTTPLMSGTAEANSLVSVFEAGVLIGTTGASALGAWSFTPTLTGEGPHAITATATDAAGNTSLPSEPWSVLIDTIPPRPPLIVTSNDNFGIYTGDIPSGTPTNDTTPLMSGTAEPDSLVSVFEAGVLIGTISASALGAWSFTPTLTGEGPHAITATATDAAGNMSAPSKPWNVLIDTIAPRPPVIAASNDNVGIYTGEIPSGTPTNDTTPLMSGTAEPDSLVSVFEAGDLVGTTSASGLGAWSFTPTLVGEGPHAITARATDAAGNTSLPSQPWTVLVDTIPPDPPVIAASNDNFGIYTGDIPSGIPTNDTTPRMSGTAEANSLVSLFDAGVAVGTGYANALGTWSLAPTLSGEGPHAITAKATDAAGNTSSPSDMWTVNIDTIPPGPPVISASSDNFGIYTGNVPSGAVTNDTTPLMSGTAEANSLVSLFDAGMLVGTVNASALGAWSLTPNLAGEGIHVVTAKATDAAGNTSRPSEIWNVNIDTIAPIPPVIVASNDNVGIYTGDIPSGTPTNDTTPLMSGTAEANSLISLFDAGVAAGTVYASALGAWSFTLTLSGEGPHAITARATDAAGNTSSPSEPWNVLVDTIAPQPPVILKSNDNFGIYTGDIPSGAVTNDTTPLMSGTAEANSLVSLFDAGVAAGTVYASALGAWSLAPTLSGEGPHAMTAKATDAAGNTSLPSEPWSVLIDTIAPEPPTITSAYDDIPIYIGNLSNGGLTNDPRPDMSGMAERHSLITLYDNDRRAGTTTTNDLGVWTLTPSLDGLGPHSVKITATDAAGNVSLRSEEWIVNVAETPNLVINGDFNDGTGLRPSGAGNYYIGIAPNWQLIVGSRMEIAVPGTSGGIDMEETPGNITIGQVVASVAPGGHYMIDIKTIDAPTNGIKVFWGGEQVMDIFSKTGISSVEVLGGAGDTSNKIVLAGYGPVDNSGMNLVDVEVHRIL